MTVAPPLANPLRAGPRLARTPQPCALVIFGATGDLAARKIVPALYNLALQRLLPAAFAVVGAARADLTSEQFRESLHTDLVKFSRTKPINQDVWRSFAESVHYVSTRDGEGFELLHASEFGLDLKRVAQVWNQGSVVRSWLLELAERAFEAEGSDLEHIKGYVADSGEGRWTIQEAIAHDVPMTALAHSLFARFTSRQEDSYAMKVAAALRNQFGGHEVKTE